MRIGIEMKPDETSKAREAAVEILTRLAPYDADVAKALEGMLTDDYVGQLPEAIRTLLGAASEIVDAELTHLESVVRLPHE